METSLPCCVTVEWYLYLLVIVHQLLFCSCQVTRTNTGDGVLEQEGIQEKGRNSERQHSLYGTTFQEIVGLFLDSCQRHEGKNKCFCRCGMVDLQPGPAAFSDWLQQPFTMFQVAFQQVAVNVGSRSIPYSGSNLLFYYSDFRTSLVFHSL